MEEVTSIFQGAEQVDMLLRPGITILEAALAANCFRTRSKGNLTILEIISQLFQEKLSLLDHCLSCLGSLLNLPGPFVFLLRYTPITKR